MAPPVTLHLPNTLSEQFANYEGVAVDLDEELDDWQLPLVFNEKRHKEEIKGAKTVAQTWRMKERVCLVICRELVLGETWCIINVGTNDKVGPYQLIYIYMYLSNVIQLYGMFSVT